MVANTDPMISQFSGSHSHLSILRIFLLRIMDEVPEI